MKETKEDRRRFDNYASLIQMAEQVVKAGERKKGGKRRRKKKIKKCGECKVDQVGARSGRS